MKPKPQSEAELDRLLAQTRLIEDTDAVLDFSERTADWPRHRPQRPQGK